MYLEVFNRLAASQGSDYGLQDTPDAILWIKADPTRKSDLSTIVPMVRRDLKQLGLTSTDLIGRCFRVAIGVSRRLCSAGVRHTFTVGDVLVDGTAFYKATPDSLRREYENGFVEGQPINAHAWITLECGTVLDMTILPSVAYHRHGRKLKLIQSIYTSNAPSPYKITHVPMILGPMFAVRTCVGTFPESLDVASRWITDIDEMMSDGGVGAA